MWEKLVHFYWELNVIGEPESGLSDCVLMQLKILQPELSS